jgi:hypothetical protein
MSEGGFTVIGMQNNNAMRELIETELFETLELDLDTEAALAEAAGLISEAEASFARLSRSMPSMPPPRRSSAASATGRYWRRR